MTKRNPKNIVTKTGLDITESWCRRCSKMIPATEFYETTDTAVDTNGLLSVCKSCTQELYEGFYKKLGSVEKSLHKMCTTLNIKYSNDAASATISHMKTLNEKGKNVNFVFGIFKSKLIATNKSMDKTEVGDLTYNDVSTIYTTEAKTDKEIPLPQTLIDFWGNDLERRDIEFLESQYLNFKNTHSADTYAEVVLLKQVCYTLLDIKNLRTKSDDTQKKVTELQNLMKNLAISPEAANKNLAGNKGDETFGLWIQDIEREEPAQWLKTDPRGDIYRDVADTEEYFQKFIVRPLKNFITQSKEFNIDDEDVQDDDDIFSDNLDELGE